MIDIATIGIAVDTKGLKAGQRELDATAKAATKTADAADKTSKSFKSLESASGALKSALAGIGVAALASQYIRMADAVTLMDARLKLAVGSGKDFAQAQKDIFQIAQRNAVEIGSVASLYTKLNDPIKAIGGSTAEVSAITEAFATSLKVSGASAAEASSATLQFAQAMGAGALRGDEFNSIAEANPRFMKALAESMGVATGELRKMAEDGKLTAGVVGGALVDSLEKLRSEGQSIPLTVGAAFQQLSNEALVLVGNFDKVTGGSGTVADLMVRYLTPALRGVFSIAVGVATAFQTVGKILGGLGALVATSVGSMMDVVTRVIGGDFAGAWDAAKSGYRTAGAVMIDVGADISATWEKAGGAINDVWSTAGSAASAATADASKLTGAVKATEDAAKKAKKAYEDWLTTFAKADTDRQNKIAEDRAKAEMDLYRQRLENEDELAAIISAKNAEWNQEHLDYLANQDKATQDYLKKQQEDASRSNEAIAQSLTNSLMEGGKSFLDYLEDYARTIILRPMLEPIGQAMSGMLGSASNMIGLSGMAAGFGSSVASGASALMAGNGIGALANSGALIGTGTAAGLATGIGTAIGVALPVVGIIAGVSSILDKKVKAQGVGAKFSGGGIDTYNFTRRGNVLGNSTSTSALNDGGAFESQLRNVQSSAAGYAQALGLTADAINGYTGDFKINLKGLSDTEAIAKMREETNKLKADMLTTAQVSHDLGNGIMHTKSQMEEMKAANLAMIEQTQAAMESAGITSAAIADVLMAGMTGRLTEAQVGEQMADIVLGGIYNTIASGPATMIAEAFTSQIIEPMMMAALTGAPMANAVSQASINAVMVTATNAMNTMNQVLNDPAFKSAMNQLYATITGLAKVSTSSAGSIKKYRSSVSSSGAAAASAANQIKTAWQSVADSVIDEVKRIRGEILGTSSESVAAYQTQFSIATAQARSGNQDAAETLVKLSKSLLDAAEGSSGSLSDYRAVQGSTMSSLEQTAAIIAQRYGLTLPSFAGGGYTGGGSRTGGVDGMGGFNAILHPNEIVTDLSNGDSGIGELRAELVKSRAAATIQAAAIDRLEKGMDKLTNGYSVMRNKEVTA